MKKEDARFALLAGSETELNLCLNFQAWQDFLHNRTGKHAQWEVRAVAGFKLKIDIVRAIEIVTCIVIIAGVFRHW